MRDEKQQLLIELSHAIGCVAVGDDERLLGIVTAIHTRLVARNKQGTLPGVPAPESKDDGRKEAVLRLFAYWQERCDHKLARLTPERATVLRARLRDGYTEAEVRKAIDGAASHAYTNDAGHRFDDLTLICRNGSKLEDFIQRGVKATGTIKVEAAAGPTSPVEDQIAELRRKMVELKKDGRTTEYEHAADELQKLMQRRTA